ncbi:CBS domain-containing protein [Thauera mechernichensis]|uniref:CBS domain-containing protein n=1 Tax=Thauera mechernichensis TaxID=82788 RepID=A0ABW3WFW7_9RHOO|nr:MULTISPECIES: CBS domain-containing protein [Thauera]ENO83051.1 signal transduction protein [Thauera sp. 27]ENO94679.1 signal transduction protein [Thauera sp. 28]MDG3063769.1 CBS domain-containing protein [Thauera mechernichensis]WBL65600.1 CBS domain-containing protein [Thauera sp. WB-2]HAG73873.1 CBS domain-containing protein [Thauera sp.]
MATSVRQILEQKGATFHAVRPTDSVFDALSLMAQFDVGSVLVIDNDRLVGIFTERDYARKVVLKGLMSRDVKVGDLMTANPHTVSLSHQVDEVMSIMTERRFRHLPVVEEGKVLGIVTIGDMVKSIVSHQKETIKHLESYIAGDLAAE